MTSPKDQYLKEIRTKFGYTPTWIPSVKIDPGDIVLMDGGAPTPIDSLRKKSYGVDLKTEEDDGAVDIHYASANGVSITFKAAGAAPVAGSGLAQASAGVTVELSRKNGVVLEALGCNTTRIADQIALGRRILELYHADKWEKDWAVVTDVVYASSFTVLLSSTSNAKIELQASGKLSVDTSIASVGAKLDVVTSRNMATQIVASEKLTPFYRAYGITGVFSKRWAQKASAAEGTPSLADLRAQYRSQMKFGPLER